jgi:hypothetical protein
VPENVPTVCAQFHVPKRYCKDAIFCLAVGAAAAAADAVSNTPAMVARVATAANHSNLIFLFMMPPVRTRLRRDGGELAAR